jgi:ribosome-binding factor A
MSRRTLKAGEAIRQVISMSILTEIQDPRVHDVTVLHVEVSGDMQIAKVHVSIMGDEAKQKLCMRGLQSSAGFLQSKVAKRIETRYTPKIEFVLDQGVKNQLYVSKVLEELLPKKENNKKNIEEFDEYEYNDEVEGDK